MTVHVVPAFARMPVVALSVEQTAHAAGDRHNHDNPAHDAAAEATVFLCEHLAVSGAATQHPTAAFQTE